MFSILAHYNYLLLVTLLVNQAAKHVILLCLFLISSGHTMHYVNTHGPDLIFSDVC